MSRSTAPMIVAMKKYFRRARDITGKDVHRWLAYETEWSVTNAGVLLSRAYRLGWMRKRREGRFVLYNWKTR